MRWTALVAMLGLLATVAYAAQIGIVSPADGDTIHDNAGDLQVVVGATLGAGERVRVLLDGVPVGADSPSTTLQLYAIDRGEHRLQAVLVDERGAVLASSATITIYMWRASAQFPLRK